MNVFVIKWRAGYLNPWIVVGVASSKERAMERIERAKVRGTDRPGGPGEYTCDQWRVDGEV